MLSSINRDILLKMRHCFCFEWGRWQPKSRLPVKIAKLFTSPNIAVKYENGEDTMYSRTMLVMSSDEYR